MKTFFKNLGYRVLVQSSKIESAIFSHKLPCQKPMLRQIEWEVQNGQRTEFLPVTTLFFR